MSDAWSNEEEAYLLIGWLRYGKKTNPFILIRDKIPGLSKRSYQGIRTKWKKMNKRCSLPDPLKGSFYIDLILLLIKSVPGLRPVEKEWLISFMIKHWNGWLNRPLLLLNPSPSDV